MRYRLDGHGDVEDMLVGYVAVATTIRKFGNVEREKNFLYSCEENQSLRILLV